MDSVPASELARERNVLFLTSTWGEGDMPDNAVTFWDGLNQNGASPALDGMNYSVLALGDLNYGETFCLAGRRLDARLAELGAHRVFERVDCDVDYDSAAEAWIDRVLEKLDASAAIRPAVGDLLLLRCHRSRHAAMIRLSSRGGRRSDRFPRRSWLTDVSMALGRPRRRGTLFYPSKGPVSNTKPAMLWVSSPPTARTLLHG